MRIIAIGDAHCPWLHKPTFTKILQIIEAFQPEAVVQMGDLFDFYSFSRFPKSPGIITAEQELIEGRHTAEEMWRLIEKACPSSKKYQILGNHCDRPIKRAKEVAPDLMAFVGPAIRRLYEFDGVETIHDSTSELILDDIVFMHGFRSKLGDHCKHNMMNTVVGHSHRGGVYFWPTIKGKQLWELNAGYIADPSADPLRYSQQRYTHWSRGLGLIDSHGPRFIPL